MESQVKQGYKKTEVGLIPEDWDTGHLSDFWSVVDCKHITAEFVSDGYPVVSIRDVQSRFVNIDEAKRTNYFYYSNLISDKRKPESGDLILSRNATVGEIAQVLESHPDFAMGQDVCLLRKKDKKYSTDYLQNVFRSWIVQNQILDSMVGSTFKRINVEQVRSFIISLPPIAEQEKIAEALSDVDSLIESLEELIAKKRHIKQGAMQELLTGKRRLIDNGEWKIDNLGNIANIVRGASPRPIDSPIWFDKNSGIGWVRISDVTKAGMTLKETTQYLSELGVKSSRFVESGSLIMSICATVGRPIMTELDVCIHDGFVVFESLRADKNFIYYVLQSIEPKWSQHGQTGSQMNLNTSLINRTEISLPPTKAEQEAIAEVLTDMDHEITVLEEQLNKTRQIKQGMMQELLTGRIRLV